MEGKEPLGTITTTSFGPEYPAETYLVTDILYFGNPPHLYFVTNIPYKTHEDGYIEPLIIADIMTETVNFIDWRPEDAIQ